MKPIAQVCGLLLEPVLTSERFFLKCGIPSLSGNCETDVEQNLNVSLVGDTPHALATVPDEPR